jgi:carboxyl-terminal processing protease
VNQKIGKEEIIMHTFKHSIFVATLALFLAPACDEPDDPEFRDAEELAGPPVSGPAGASAPPSAGGSVSAEHAGGKHAKPRRTMPGAKAAFAKMAKLVEEHYVEGPLSEDELWTGAMEGVLDRLIQLEEHPINVLLSPEEHNELVIGTKGKLVGVGIMISRVADIIVVNYVMPTSPAETAGLRAGDRILGIDGVRVQTMSLEDVVLRIRGEEGTTVELFVQRDTEEWTETITRGQVEVPSVATTMLPDGVGYLQISSFGTTSGDEIDAKLRELKEAGMRTLVIDLRDCPGGLFDAALAVADRFLPPGATIVTVQNRDGTEQVHTAQDDHPWQQVPLAVLIGKSTASGAEILADALREAGRATVIGEPTMGKETVEGVHELDNGWAVKLSTSRFVNASGRSGSVSPQIRIPMPQEKSHTPLSELADSDDPVLAAARELLTSG